LIVAIDCWKAAIIHSDCSHSLWQGSHYPIRL